MTNNYAERIIEALVKERDQLRAELARVREVLNNVQHGHICPAQTGWLDAGPCNCGLDAALAAGEGEGEKHE